MSGAIYPCLKDRLVVVTAPGHPWTRRTAPLDAAELSGRPLILREEGSGTRQDPWLFDGYTVGGDEWEVLLEEPYEATAEILAHDDVNVPPPDGTEYWIVPVTAIYYGPSSQVSAWGAVDVGFVGDDGVHVDGQCGAVPHALVGTGLIGTDDTVTGNVCVAVPAGAPGLWTLSLEGYQRWYF